MKTKHIALGAAVMGIAYFVIKNKKAKGLACPPTDEKTKLTFSSIQLGVNLLLTQQNKSRIGLTGTIDGPTVDAVNSLLGTKFATCADQARARQASADKTRWQYFRGRFGLCRRHLRMIYSVWNQGARQYDYYETNTVQNGANTPPPKHIRAEPLGATIDQAAWPLPTSARKIGSGEFAKGRIGSRGSNLLSLGAIPLSANTIGIIGFGIAAYVLWKSGFLKT
jgi:hypothetical protein